jgi:hypothetical protein
MRIWAPRLFRGSVYDPGMEQFAPQDTQPDTEPHSEIARLEARIEELALRLEGCRKYAAAALTAMGLGAVLLAAALTGVIQLDAVTVMAAASCCPAPTAAPRVRSKRRWPKPKPSARR